MLRGKTGAWQFYSGTSFTETQPAWRHSLHSARPRIQRSCVSVATCRPTCIGLLARLESYLVLISISLTIYHYGVDLLCRGGLQEWDTQGQPIHGIILSVSIRAEITTCLVGNRGSSVPATDGSHTIRSALITFILMTSLFHISRDKIWE